MPFEKGKSGNPAGRPRGSSSKFSSEIRDIIGRFIMGQLDGLQPLFNAIEKLEEKLKFLLGLMPYVVPKMKQIELQADINASPKQIDLSVLSDEELKALSEIARKLQLPLEG